MVKRNLARLSKETLLLTIGEPLITCRDWEREKVLLDWTQLDKRHTVTLKYTLHSCHHRHSINRMRFVHNHLMVFFHSSYKIMRMLFQCSHCCHQVATTHYVSYSCFIVMGSLLSKHWKKTNRDLPQLFNSYSNQEFLFVFARNDVIEILSLCCFASLLGW